MSDETRERLDEAAEYFEDEAWKWRDAANKQAEEGPRKAGIDQAEQFEGYAAAIRAILRSAPVEQQPVAWMVEHRMPHDGVWNYNEYDLVWSRARADDRIEELTRSSHSGYETRVVPLYRAPEEQQTKGVRE